MKMLQTECSEMSAYKIQAYNIQNTAKVWNQKTL